MTSQLNTLLMCGHLCLQKHQSNNGCFWTEVQWMTSPRIHPFCCKDKGSSFFRSLTVYILQSVQMRCFLFISANLNSVFGIKVPFHYWFYYSCLAYFCSLFPLLLSSLLNLLPSQFGLIRAVCSCGWYLLLAALRLIKFQSPASFCVLCNLRYWSDAQPSPSSRCRCSETKQAQKKMRFRYTQLSMSFTITQMQWALPIDFTHPFKPYTVGHSAIQTFLQTEHWRSHIQLFPIKTCNNKICPVETLIS